MSTQAEAIALKLPLRLWAALREAVQQPHEQPLGGVPSEALALTDHASMPSVGSEASISTLQEGAEQAERSLVTPPELAQPAGEVGVLTTVLLTSLFQAAITSVPVLHRGLAYVMDNLSARWTQDHHFAS